MEVLVAHIQTLEASDIPDRPYLTETDHPLVSVIARMLEDIFITAGGHLNHDARDRLMHDYGYELYPVEQDRWGWVIGGLQTKKGTVTFG